MEDTKANQDKLMVFIAQEIKKDGKIPPFDYEACQAIVEEARRRSGMVIIGEVRGEEAKDMMTAMNIGKISMGTIHAGNTRDVITRLQNTPMNVDQSQI